MSFVEIFIFIKKRKFVHIYNKLNYKYPKKNWELPKL